MEAGGRQAHVHQGQGRERGALPGPDGRRVGEEGKGVAGAREPKPALQRTAAPEVPSRLARPRAAAAELLVRPQRRSSRMPRAPFQILVFPYAVAADGATTYEVFTRADGGVWSVGAGGGDVGETP